MSDKQDDPVGDAVTDLLDKVHGRKPLTEAQIGGDQELTNEQRSRLPYVMGMYHTCYVCNAEPPPAGFYTWQVKDQIIVTPVCENCKRLVGIEDAVAAILARRMIEPH